MPDTSCPKCGFEQNAGEECLRCGIVFARYHSRPAAPVRHNRRHAGFLPCTLRVLRWLVPAGLVLVLLLILRPSAPPAIEIPPDAANRAQAKVQAFQTAAQQGGAETLALDGPEINSWLQQNFALRRPADEDLPSQINAEERSGSGLEVQPFSASEEPTVEQIRSTVRDVKLELGGGVLTVYVVFELYGKEMSLELTGRLETRDGYLRLIPTAGKLGSLPLPAATLDAAAERLFDSPQNREKFRLPPQIKDVRVPKAMTNDECRVSNDE